MDMENGSGTLTGVNKKHAKIKKQTGAEPDVLIIESDEEVVWDAPDGGGEFNVHFEDSPFAKNDFDNGDNTSGLPIKHPPGKPKCYKYSVKVDGQIIDPIVIVRG
jgi:hypothetical protein